MKRIVELDGGDGYTMVSVDFMPWPLHLEIVKLVKVTVIHTLPQ